MNKIFEEILALFHLDQRLLLKFSTRDNLSAEQHKRSDQLLKMINTGVLPCGGRWFGLANLFSRKINKNKTKEESPLFI